MQSNDPKIDSRWCIFTSAGDHNNVLAWKPDSPERRWDLITAFYGDDDAVFNQLKTNSTVAFRSKGSKFQNLRRIYKTQPEIFAGYDFVFVADDDIHITVEQINRLFEIAAAYDFWICHPAFNPEGRVSHSLTRKLGTHIRITNFVELTCPIFRSDKLFEFLQVYDGELVGWGIDWWYCNYFDANTNRKVAIIDEVTVINPHDHQRPGGTREIEKLQTGEVRAQKWRETAEKLGLTEYEMRNLAFINEPAPSLAAPQEARTKPDVALSFEDVGRDEAVSLLRGVLKERDWLIKELQLLNTKHLQINSELEQRCAAYQKINSELNLIRDEHAGLRNAFDRLALERNELDELKNLRNTHRGFILAFQRHGGKLKEIQQSRFYRIWRAYLDLNEKPVIGRLLKFIRDL